MHPARIGLDRLVDKGTQTAEIDDRVELAVELSPGHAVQHAAQVYVVASAVLRIEAEAEFKDRGDPPGYLDSACGRVENPGHDLEQCALARPVGTDDSEHLAARNLEAHIFERTEAAVAPLARQDLERQIGRLLIDHEILRYIADANGDVAQCSILKPRCPGDYEGERRHTSPAAGRRRPSPRARPRRRDARSC